jgi:chromosomal replication initiation ATPase DnaA
MRENEEVEYLLTNIQKGLKIYSVKELNNAISKILTKKEEKVEEINYVLDLVCEHFEISLSQLKKKGARGRIIDAKQTAYCLLHFNMGLPIRYIAKKIFNNWPNSISTGIKRVKNADIKIKQDEIFMLNYKKLQQKLTLYITTTK